MIQIDAKKCTKCGFCADECPSRIFRMVPGPEGGCTVQTEYLGWCTGCAHCIAICPANAILHDSVSADRLMNLPDAAVPPDTMRAFLLSRRSVRAFKEKPVPGETIGQLIEAGVHAGTASNAQTENFIVIQDQKLLTELENMVVDIVWDKLKILGSAIGRGLARMKFGEQMVQQSVRYYEGFKDRREKGETEGLVFRKAPAVIAVDGLRANHSAHENCAIAARNMELLAMSLGLGTCWAGFLLVAAGFSDKIARRLGLGKERNVYSAFMLGYPKHEYRKGIGRQPREVRWL